MAKLPHKTPVKARFTAATADRHQLYQLSVQDTSHELEFIDKVFKQRNKRLPASLREDFCGTALLSAAWVGAGAQRTAVGVDLDREVLAWGKKHNVEPLGEGAERLTLLRQNVLEGTSTRHDVIVALNFSYWIFKKREELRRYFAQARADLAPGGLFVLDAYGGYEGQEVMEETRQIRAGFTYVWDQATFNPIDHTAINYIHFHFRDGTKLQKAFTYEWRFWSLPELREILVEAGFGKVDVYWDVSEDEDTSHYRVRKTALNQPGWLAFLVATS